MNKYFAKYLPIVGEIKEGDFYFHTKMGLTLCGKGSAKNGNLAKLFLCSRDIQVGDIYYNTDYNTYRTVKSFGETSPYLVYFDNSGVFDYRKDCIKVIGEISPEATWLKEGDEFDEDNLKYVTWYSRLSIDDNAGYLELSPFKEGKKKDWSRIAIKGPCGHFH